MNIKLLISIVTIALIAIIAYVIFSSTITDFDQQPDPSETPNEITEGPITEQGVITCIPKIGDGPQTMECALGLQTTEGLYYGLRYLSDHDQQFALVSPDITVEITGTLIDEEMYGPDGNRYDTLGIIEIETISEI